MTQSLSQRLLLSSTDMLALFGREVSYRVSSIMPLKTRHILTRDNRLRLRYIVSGFAGVILIAGLYANGSINASEDDKFIVADTAFIEQIEPEAGISETGPILSYMMDAGSAARSLFESKSLNKHRDSNGQIRRDRNVIESVGLAENNGQSPAAEEITFKIEMGQTLASALQKAGIEEDEAQTVLNKVAENFDMRTLQAGQEMHMVMEPADTKTGYQLASLSFAPSKLKTVDVSRNDDGEIVATIDEKEVKKLQEARSVPIKGSIYASADKADLPDRITAKTIKLLSYAVDFQRDIKSGDKLEVMYDSYRTDEGDLAKTGDIIFAKLKVGGKEYALYRYELDGKADYYTADGKSIRKSSGLMRTPVAVGRMVSGFGMRRHPILGYTKMHKGVDFAAPTGTPVFASGDGVIEKASRFSSYGNYVQIRHSSKISSSYAHLSRYGKGIRPGVRVKQGQIIGYVGSTGRSTGPHLHYEILVNNVAVNPSSVKYSGDNALKGRALEGFKRKVRSLGQEYAESVKESVKVASR